MIAVKLRKLGLITLFAVYTLELLMMVVVYVVFSPMLLDPKTALLAADTSVATRDLVLGFLLAAFPLTQIFGAPILGEFSDRFGRRPVLLVATLGSGLFTMLSAVAIPLGSLWLLFVARLVAGFFGGCTTVAMAGVADLTAPEVRGRYMSGLVMAGGLGWIVGPYIGSLFSEISFAAPFWFTGALFLVLTVLVWVAFAREERPAQKLHLGKAFGNLLEVFKERQLRTPLLILVVTLIGWLIYQAFLAAYLIQKYGFSEEWEGTAYAVASAWWLVGGLAASLWVLKKYDARRAAIVPIFLSALSVLSFQFFNVSLGVWPALAVANFSQAIAQSAILTVLSLMAHRTMQGRVFGTVSAGVALAGVIAPSVDGWLAGYSINLPFLAGGIVLLAMALCYTLWAFRHWPAS